MTTAKTRSGRPCSERTVFEHSAKRLRAEPLVDWVRDAVGQWSPHSRNGWAIAPHGLDHERLSPSRPEFTSAILAGLRLQTQSVFVKVCATHHVRDGDKWVEAEIVVEQSEVVTKTDALEVTVTVASTRRVDLPTATWGRYVTGFARGAVDGFVATQRDRRLHG